MTLDVLSLTIGAAAGALTGTFATWHLAAARARQARLAVAAAARAQARLAALARMSAARADRPHGTATAPVEAPDLADERLTALLLAAEANGATVDPDRRVVIVPGPDPDAKARQIILDATRLYLARKREDGSKEGEGK